MSRTASYAAVFLVFPPTGGWQSPAAQVASAVAAAVPVEPIRAILQAFESHQLVALGDAHGNEQGQAFQFALIRDREFADVVDDILVELGNSRYQELMDRFLRGENVPEENLRRAWRETAQQQVAPWEMPELLRVVQEVNSNCAGR